MLLAKENGGKSIAVYAKNQEEKAKQLVADDRVNFICEADYRTDSMLDKVVKLTLQQMAITEALSMREVKG